MTGNQTPKFSIIVPHYDGAINDTDFIRGMLSLKSQTFTDFEVLLYHDGPTSRPIPDVGLRNITTVITDKRYNDWGHSLRDMGIKAAKGEYIIHFNPDNVLYHYALQHIYDKSKEGIINQPTNEIIIFPILMMGMQFNGRILWRDRQNAQIKYLIFTGFPTIKNNIDCMQVVIKRDIWMTHNGWFDKTEQSDGNMYPAFVNKYGARYCSVVLGEHR